MSVDQSALFVENEFTATDDLILTGGLRLDHHETYGNHWNPRGYAVYYLTDEITIKGAFLLLSAHLHYVKSVKVMAPLPKGNGIIYGNPDLKPEKALVKKSVLPITMSLALMRV